MFVSQIYVLPYTYPVQGLKSSIGRLSRNQCDGAANLALNIRKTLFLSGFHWRVRISNIFSFVRCNLILATLFPIAESSRARKACALSASLPMPPSDSWLFITPAVFWVGPLTPNNASYTNDVTSYFRGRGEEGSSIPTSALEVCLFLVTVYR